MLAKKTCDKCTWAPCTYVRLLSEHEAQQGATGRVPSVGSVDDGACVGGVCRALLGEKGCIALRGVFLKLSTCVTVPVS